MYTPTTTLYWSIRLPYYSTLLFYLFFKRIFEENFFIFFVFIFCLIGRVGGWVCFVVVVGGVVCLWGWVCGGLFSGLFVVVCLFWVWVVSGLGEWWGVHLFVCLLFVWLLFVMWVGYCFVGGWMSGILFFVFFCFFVFLFLFVFWLFDIRMGMGYVISIYRFNIDITYVQSADVDWTYYKRICS